MSDKKVHNLHVDRAMQRIAKPSVFDEIVKEVETSEIPVEYIERIMVFYANGNIVELSGSEITHPVPVNRRGSAEDMEEPFKQMREVKVYIDTEKLERNINQLVELLLGRHC